MRKPDNRSPQFIAAAVIGWTLLTQAGCVQNTGVSVLTRDEQAGFRGDCLRFMEDCAFSHEPSLRMQAIEAFAQVAPKEGVQRKAIPLNIENKYSGIVFASLMATGEMEASQFEQLVRTRAESQDKNVRIAAIFALYRLGDRSRINELGQFLLADPDDTVRANAALAVGRMRDPRMIKVLREALRNEKKESPRMQILEALAILGDEKAIERLMFVGRSAIPQDAAIALMMLANARSRDAEELFWVRLRDSRIPEVRILAIRGLAGLGKRDVLPLAIEYLSFNDPDRHIPHDPPEQQIKRIRGIAALALEELGVPEGLEPLRRAFFASGQPDYVRLAIARAAVRTIDQTPRR
ncbi:MAG TPA: HEAT repeat domain-containing protein [Phycisphaerae bacterium]|nr:HEAT repeat domain-containing protein [Phycisphaerae bacterium]HRW53873.1 HEAT repeat domain-containing protein [Phycisphaerae bacterium]